MTQNPTTQNFENMLAVLLDRARSAGADAADALVHRSVSQSVSVRLGEVEDIERSEGRDLGLRVLIGQRQASVSTTDFSDHALTSLVERAVAMAKLAPEDKWCGLADPSLLSKGPFPDLDMSDDLEPSADELRDRALACEGAARAVDGITNSSGAGAAVGSGESWFGTTTGFFGHNRGGSHSLSVSVVAGEGTSMETDYDYDSKTHMSDMRTPEMIGARAADRTVARLNPRKLESQKAPVVFHQRLASSLLSPLAGGINGAAIARGTSFLKEMMGEQLFPKNITITDDPLIKRGFGSRPFDGEGMKTEKLNIIDKGHLTTWTLNQSQARQLNLSPNGRATRGTGGVPGSSTTNLDLGAGAISVENLYKDLGTALLVTDMFGPQINPNNGDYSVGCSGFWITGGVVGEPVSEITIAGNLLDMWKALIAADDFERRGSTNAPTLSVGMMTIAGS